MSHRDEVAYVKELLGKVDLPPGWSARKLADTWYAEGPCPTCRGAASASGLPEVDGEAPDERVGGPDVPVTCGCGYDHGEVGAANCGRSWIVRVDVTSGPRS